MWKPFDKNDIVDTKIGNLFVNSISNIEKNNRVKARGFIYYYNCHCDCGKDCIKERLYLQSNRWIHNCGCLTQENISRSKHRNNYKFFDNYIIGYTKNNEEFYFDLEDYDIVKDYNWTITKQGRVSTSKRIGGKQRQIMLHQLVFGKNCDHIDRDPKNNRKNNLRNCTHMENMRNCSLSKNNTSGFVGVGWHKEKRKWQSSITVNKKEIIIGRYQDKKEAIFNRLLAEKKYFGDFAPQRHLFKEYGISEDAINEY